MTRSVIDPISRIEGHLRVEMEVENGVVSDAWVSGGLFRGMELVLENRQPADAAYISQRICGVCPVSHSHASCFAGEAAYGISIPANARIIRNMIEGAQFLHSNILWFYNLTGLDYVNPVNGLSADISDAATVGVQSITDSTPLIETLMGLDIMKTGSDYEGSDFTMADTQVADFLGVQNRLQAFVDNGQLSIFTGNWFDSGAGDEYKLTPELDLIATTHYLEALQMQAKASQISGLMGGKMPHIMSSLPGGTTFQPSPEKLADILYRAKEIRDWVAGTLVPDTLVVAPAYVDDFGYGKGCGNYVAWGVFDKGDDNGIHTNDTSTAEYFQNRYLPGGIVYADSTGLKCDVPDESKILEFTNHSYYEPDTTGYNPREGVTAPQWPSDGYNIKNRYSWSKSPRYDGKPFEAGPLSRALSAYLQGNEYYTTAIDGALKYLGDKLGTTLDVSTLQSTLGRVAARNLETLYVAQMEVNWCLELIAAIAGGTEADISESGDNKYFLDPARTTGSGEGMWEAPRGALYHYESITNNKIDKYQIIIPSTWNIGPEDGEGQKGPMEQALIGCPVNDVEKPIQALRTVHSFDPCIACAVHVNEPATGKSFSTVTSPWGVR